MFFYINLLIIFIPGYYCPEGTSEYDQFPCLPGTYGASEGLRSADECSPCPAGYVCTHGTTDFGDPTTQPQPCKQGYYCPAMTTAPDRWPCPPGTFSNRSDLTDASECTNCTAGYYCRGRANHNENIHCKRHPCNIYFL